MKDQLPNAAVKHVVVLMLENRGFDHLMGWLYNANENPNIVGADNAPFQGLSTIPDPQLQGMANPSPLGGTVQINKGARSPKTPAYNTGESFPHIFNQMWGGGFPPAAWKDATTRNDIITQLRQQGQPKMDGYVKDYYEDVLHHCKKGLGATELSEVMDIYLPCQMPVLSGLARYYAVSDQWFCSVPSQTNTNRAFSMTGASRGMVSNSFYDPPTDNWGINNILKPNSEGVSNADALPVSTRSLFEVLEQSSYSWRYYFQDWWPPYDVTLWKLKWQYARTMIPFLANPQFDANFVKFAATDAQNRLFTDIRNGTLPAVSWIEPKWGGGPQWDTKFRAVGNDYHPVSDTTTGEDFVMDLYNELTSSPAWNDTLLVITFDENGGTYDHQYPPQATPTYLDACPLPQPTDWKHMDPTTRTQYGFDFAQFGVRVPTLLISPRVPQATIFRSNTNVPYDHTSLIATILTLAQVDKRAWELGARTDAAPTFEGLVQGPVRNGIDPSQGLRAPSDEAPDPNAVAVQTNTPYVLEYIGNAWGVTASARCYLGPSSMGKIPVPSYYYPTLVTDVNQAVQFQLIGDGGVGAPAPIQNMSIVRLMTTEASKMGLVLLTVNNELPWVYYGSNGGADGAKWQIRILNSRNRGDQVRTSDRFYFVSRLQPGSAQTLSERTTPDPLQRLMPYPKDPQYATTQAGEWALWRIAPAPPPLPVPVPIPISSMEDVD
jgi:phospholipase C